MKYFELLENVEQKTGLPHERAHGLIEATLRVFSRMLPRNERQALKAALPLSFGRIVEMEGEELRLDPESFIEMVGEAFHLNKALAREAVPVVCGEFADAIDDALLERWLAALPEGFASLFEAPPDVEPLPPRHPKAGTTLADGRPGGSHPISETGIPVVGLPPHRESIVVRKNPHEAEKLSSARPPDESTLAQGRPGSCHPIADAGKEEE
ncbi:MAG: DUF2267 domain-containing protein [Deltaproteobacteria bacterium]|nr:MAG: DUF2267 domain-containing protein [Deltaproteobacteria bacterium]